MAETEIWSPRFQLLILSQSLKFLSCANPFCLSFRLSILMPKISLASASKFPDEDSRRNFRYFRCQNRKCVPDWADRVAKGRTRTWPVWARDVSPASDRTFVSAEAPSWFLRSTRRARSRAGRPPTRVRRNARGPNAWHSEIHRAGFLTW